MAKRAPSGNPSEEENRINTLDVALLDLFAETEAILRCGGEIEPSIVTLRGGMELCRRRNEFPSCQKFTKPL
jgi:hypothetical protein